MNRIAILGAGGHGKVIGEIALLSGWNSVDFYDDGEVTKKSSEHFPILGGVASLFENSDYYDGFHVAIGDNQTRLHILSKFLELGMPCPNLISPSSVISQSVILGSGISIMANVVVTTNAILGNGVILNTSCSVDHDCRLESGVHIGPGAHLAGDVSVGRCSWIGIGSTVIPGKVIGENTIIGAGSAVISDIPNGVTAVGVPSKIIK